MLDVGAGGSRAEQCSLSSLAYNQEASSADLKHAAQQNSPCAIKGPQSSGNTGLKSSGNTALKLKSMLQALKSQLSIPLITA